MRTATLLLSASLLTGCAASGPGGLPGGSALVAENQPTLTFTAPDKGTVFLLDPAARRVVFQTPIDKGQRVEVDSKSNRVTIDGRPAPVAATLRPDASYQLFFKAAGKREYHPMYNP